VSHGIVQDVVKERQTGKDFPHLVESGLIAASVVDRT
jgi:hypothetical protein